MLTKKCIRLVLTVVLLMTIINCKDKSLNSTQEKTVAVSVNVTDSSLITTNNLSEDIHVLLAEQNIAAVSLYFFGCDTVGVIPGKASKEIKYREISNYSKDCKIIVYWWQCDSGVVSGPNNILIQSK